ncbi:toll-like receptor 3 [Gadus macrocephalus]|uniref:toll-like receptor 3 n=1 Tax=Gadus macrocephalus TaxID=80720 RepID=UPI0028CB60D6|nr:toll-like receptor 3 [Gadus macrocephalus]
MPLPHGANRLLCCLALFAHLTAANHGRTASEPKKTACIVRGASADCSHMNLNVIPQDLPQNITRLDVSHNRLTGLPGANLSRYAGLLDLDVTFNSLTKLDPSLCQTLSRLRTLNLEHNEVHVLRDQDLSGCVQLTVLNMASNRLALKAKWPDPFAALENLTTLDVSKNMLLTAKLGSKPQLPRLVALTLSHNTISTLKKEDFYFLSRSPSLFVLNLSYLPLKKFEDGCFQRIANISFLKMDGCNLASQITKLCTELSDTAIHTLSLQNATLLKLTNITFKGLHKTNLTILDLSSNKMSAIEKGAFQWLPTLKTLHLEKNNFKHLTKDTFVGLESLKELNLRQALVKSQTSSTSIIDDYTFSPLVALETLILEHTAIRSITENTFTGLTSLQYFYIGWSSCTSLKSLTEKTFVSLAASPLRLVNLTATAITSIGNGSFSAFPNLTTLLLDFNFISQTLQGAEFEGLGQLEQLFFSNNRQKVELRSLSFVQLPKLSLLTLGRTLTGSLDLVPSPFAPLKNLKVLDLSNNNIANINARMLEGLENLMVLKMQHNNLARVWKSANVGGPVLFLKDLGNLTVLNMEYNGLDEIPTDALTGLKKLKEMRFTGNLLNNLKDSVFEDLLSLQTFSIQKNLITSVRPQVFKPAMENLTLLDMGRNPFDCTCESILWFVTWLNTTKASLTGGKDQFTCNTPLAYFNRSVMDFDLLSCKDSTPFQALYILSSTIVIALMLGALLVRFQGWRIQFYWNVLINRTLGFSDAKVEEGREFEFDAYVIHADEDQKWVERSLLPLETDRYVFCMEGRDFLPGTSRIEAIVDNMRRSRKYLFVVTESLLNDHWCRGFKAHHALHRVMEERRDAVILVFLQDINDYRLSRSLFLRRGMLQLRCLLYWPVHKERIPAFHEKLHIALGTTNTPKP